MDLKYTQCNTIHITYRIADTRCHNPFDSQPSNVTRTGREIIAPLIILVMTQEMYYFNYPNLIWLFQKHDN